MPDRFNELLDRIRDIRASERRMYLRQAQRGAGSLGAGGLDVKRRAAAPRELELASQRWQPFAAFARAAVRARVLECDDDLVAFGGDAQRHLAAVTRARPVLHRVLCE
ncbi:hypothetical protein [Pseudomonas aeruginosa]|uniref:hypothetical protein n=1 Tax=Pseudomonas aeruginosa TaxID=287 RepID=UPI00314545D8